MEKLSSLWIELQKNNKLPRSGLTTSCQEELLELMRQLDIMLTNKRREWEHQTEAIKSQLEMKDKELQMQTTTLEHKNRQVEDLSSQLRTASLSRESVLQQYESQVLELNNEVKRMKHEYEKLQKKYAKQAKETERLKSNSNAEIADGQSEVKRLKDRLEEVQQRLKDSEQIRKSLRKQVDALDAQKKALAEKCEFIQHQSSTYQSQIGQRRNLQDNTELTLKTAITQLEGQIDRNKDTIKSQEEKVKTLKASLSEAMNAHKRAMNDNERLLDDLKKANTNIRHLEGEKQQYEMEIQSRDDLLRAANEDAYQYSHNISLLEQSLNAKDEIIKNLGDSSRQEQSDQVELLQQSLKEKKEDCRDHKRTEKRLRDEMSVLESKLENANALRYELEEKESELYHIKTREMKSLQTQIEELQNKLLMVERSHDGELDGMKIKLTELTTDLHDRHTSIATLTDKTSRLEQQLVMNKDLLEGREAELKVALAQTEALRVENRHLRQDFMEKLGSVCSRLDAEHQLELVSGEYAAVISRLENENQNLQDDLSKLKHDMAVKDKRLQERSRTPPVSPNNSTHNIMNQSQNVIEVCMNSTVDRYESQIRLLQAQKQRLEEELELERRQSRRMTNGINRSELNQSIGTNVDSEPMSLVHTFQDTGSSPLSMEYELESSADAAAELFLSQEQERAKELERLIDSHIENLRVGTEQTIQRYIQK